MIVYGDVFDQYAAHATFHGITPIAENSDSGMSSLESSPSDAATSRFARKKWSSAIRVVQGLHRFRLPIYRREVRSLLHQ
ncbi:hypothetical protein Q1695_006632 [Nippostrongylus brasiliensis]|nr:hypothetical protein Q1695_006632 [Nippostrongylus brasiliensis]